MLYQATRHYDTEKDIATEQENIRNWLSSTNDKAARLKTILTDYKIGNDEVSKRDNVTLLVGTILITSSFLIFGNVATTQNPQLYIYSLASIGLFLIWLFVLHETGKNTNKITYIHLKAIEKGLSRYFQNQKINSPLYEFGTHYRICKKTNDQSTPWLRIRRMFWAFVLCLLSLSWMLLSVKII